MYGSLDKIAELQALATVRQKEAWPGYHNIADFHGGIYESLHVSPYTRGAGNCDSPIFLLLQDWCSADFLDRLTEQQKKMLAKLGRAPWLWTNKNLTTLLDEQLGTTLEACYVTNLLPFIKSGEMTASVKRDDLRRAAKVFAIPQIQIVRPKQVVCLGAEVFRSIRHALGMPLTLGGGSQVGKCFDWDDIRIWCQAHPGGLGCANRGGLDGLRADWAAMVGDSSFEV